MAMITMGQSSVFLRARDRKKAQGHPLSTHLGSKMPNVVPNLREVGILGV